MLSQVGVLAKDLVAQTALPVISSIVVGAIYRLLHVWAGRLDQLLGYEPSAVYEAQESVHPVQVEELGLGTCAILEVLGEAAGCGEVGFAKRASDRLAAVDA